MFKINQPAISDQACVRRHTNERNVTDMKKNIFTHQYDDDNILIDALIAGDGLAYEYAIEAYHNLMLAVARAIVGDSIADEIVQDAWISAIKSLPKFERRSAFKTWLLQIVSNAAKTRIKRENRFSSLDDGWQTAEADKFDQTGHRINGVPVWEDNTPEQLLANEQLQDIIEKSYQSLPAMQRAVLKMIDIEGYSLNEVCNILDLSSSNARVLLHRARSTVHAAIADYQET